MAEPLSCPYCNAYVATTEPPRSGERLNCSRCGETFTYRNPDAGTPRNGPASVPNRPPTAEPFPPPPNRRPNSTVAGVILAVMGAMACVGLALALMTTSTRREHDTGRSRQPVRNAVPDQSVTIAPVRTTPPASLAGLRYLPDSPQVVAGIHVAEARESEAGAQALASFGAQRVLTAPGLTLEALDHVVLGLDLNEKGPDKPLLRLTIVVRARVSYDPAQVRKQLRAVPLPATHEGKAIYPLNLPLSGALWCADERTLVVIFRFDGKSPIADFDPIPLHPEGEREPLKSRLSRAQERLARGAQVWVVGEAEHWDSLLRGVPAGVLSAPDREALEAVHRFAVSVRANGALAFNAALECRSDETAERLSARLDSWVAKGRRVTKVARENWITVQVHTDVESTREAVNRLLAAFLHLPAPER